MEFDIFELAIHPMCPIPKPYKGSLYTAMPEWLPRRKPSLLVAKTAGP